MATITAELKYLVERTVFGISVDQNEAKDHFQAFVVEARPDYGRELHLRFDPINEEVHKRAMTIEVARYADSWHVTVRNADFCNSTK